MTQNATTARSSTDTVPSRSKNLIFDILIGLTALAVLLQGVWAGIFLEHDGKRDDSASWIDVHARGADIAIILGVLAFVVGLIKLRDRKDLLVGTALLVILLVVEAYIGGLIRDDGKDTLTAVHVPLAMVIVGLAVWLPARAAYARRPSRERVGS